LWTVAASPHRWRGSRDCFVLRQSSARIGGSSAGALEFIGTTSTKTSPFALFSLREQPMKITRQIAADKIADYLHGKLTQTDLVDWAERAMMDADFDEADTDLLTDIVGRLGVADVAEFGLRWQDCEEFLRRLGYRAKVIVSTE